MFQDADLIRFLLRIFKTRPGCFCSHWTAASCFFVCWSTGGGVVWFWLPDKELWEAAGGGGGGESAPPPPPPSTSLRLTQRICPGTRSVFGPELEEDCRSEVQYSKYSVINNEFITVMSLTTDLD